MIPHKAVEAAVEAFVGAKGTLNDHILAILEAAAPHMLADGRGLDKEDDNQGGRQ